LSSNSNSNSNLITHGVHSPNKQVGKDRSSLGKKLLNFARGWLIKLGKIKLVEVRCYASISNTTQSLVAKVAVQFSGPVIALKMQRVVYQHIQQAMKIGNFGAAG